VQPYSAEGGWLLRLSPIDRQEIVKIAGFAILDAFQDV
jgi:hypothetical protein